MEPLQPTFGFQGASAALSLLSLLGAAVTLAMAAIATVVLGARRQWFAARWVVLGAAPAVGAYLAVAGAFSALSGPRPAGEEAAPAAGLVHDRVTIPIPASGDDVRTETER